MLQRVAQRAPFEEQVLAAQAVGLLESENRRALIVPSLLALVAATGCSLFLPREA